jgi:TonB family protein
MTSMRRSLCLLLVSVGSLSLGCGGPPPPQSAAGPGNGAAATSAPNQAEATASATAQAEPPPREKPKSDGRSQRPADVETAAPPPPPPNPKAAVVDDTQLMGQLTPAQLEAVLEKNSNAFYKCFDATNKPAKGTVVVKATIGPSGKVNAADVQKSSTGDKRVDACVLDVIKAAKFPTPKNGATQVVTVPITFESKGG